MNKFDFNNINAKEAFSNSIFNSIGSIFDTISMRQSVKSSISQIKTDTEYSTKQVLDIMGNNAIAYLKRGIGISGSALEVIRQTGETGYNNIADEINYTTDNLKDNIRGFRNQVILSGISNIANIGFNAYIGGTK